MQRKSLDWFLYDRDFRHKKVKYGLQSSNFNCDNDSCHAYSNENCNHEYLIEDTGIFRTLPNIYEGIYCENSSSLRAVNYFHKDVQS